MFTVLHYAGKVTYLLFLAHITSHHIASLHLTSPRRTTPHLISLHPFGLSLHEFATTNDRYDTESFLDKNKDFVLPEQITLLRSSKNNFLRSLLPAHYSGDQQYKFVSVGSQFSVSLAGLMKTISLTAPHYIRCIKPNPTKSPQVNNREWRGDHEEMKRGWKTLGEVIINT